MRDRVRGAQRVRMGVKNARARAHLNEVGRRALRSFQGLQHRDLVAMLEPRRVALADELAVDKGSVRAAVLQSVGVCCMRSSSGHVLYGAHTERSARRREELTCSHSSPTSLKLRTICRAEMAVSLSYTSWQVFFLPMTNSPVDSGSARMVPAFGSRVPLNLSDAIASTSE
eukprot:1288262-Prymnesium_polylepis.1